jgi:hypothetical protein
MKLQEYEGKNVRVTFKDGDVLEGVARDYTSALDNTGEDTPNVETICIGCLEFTEKEIASIELL